MSSTTGTDRLSTWPRYALIVLFVIWCAYAFTSQRADPDLWGHTQYGEDLLRDGLPKTTTYSYTAVGYEWVNHENLTEILLAWGNRHFGPAGLVIGKCLLGLTVVALLAEQAIRKRLSWIAFLVTGVLVVVNLRPSWTLRPQVPTYVCTAFMFWLLERCFSAWRGPLYWNRTASPETKALAASSSTSIVQPWLLFTLIPVFALWINFHGGFLAGLAMLAAHLSLRAFEVIRAARDYRQVLFLAGILGLSALATLVNPYGYRLHEWTLFSVPTPRPEISEWNVIGWEEPKAWNYWLLVVASVVVIGWSKRPVDFVHLIILGIIAWQATLHRRHVAFFALAFGFWAQDHVHDYLAGSLGAIQGNRASRERAAKTSLVDSRFSIFSLAAVIAAAILLSVVTFRQLQWVAVPRDFWPVDALQFMTDQKLTRGRIVVTFGWAQYVLAAFGHPTSEENGLLVACDGRCDTAYPQEVLDWFLDFELGHYSQRYRSPKSPSIDASRALLIGNPDLVLISRQQENSVRTMQLHQADWALLYQDGTAQLWGRKTVYDAPASPRYVPFEKRQVSDTPRTGSVAWPAYPAEAHKTTNPI